MNNGAPNATAPRILTAAEKKWQALDFRKRGMGYRQIADELGCCLSAAHGYVCDALKELREKTMELAEELRDIEVQKLTDLEMDLRDRLKDADAQDAAKLSAVIVKITESRRKLLGIDAPQKVEMSGNLYTVQEASPACQAWDGPPAPALLEPETPSDG